MNEENQKKALLENEALRRRVDELGKNASSSRSAVRWLSGIINLFSDATLVMNKKDRKVIAEGCIPALGKGEDVYLSATASKCKISLLKCSVAVSSDLRKEG